MEGLSHDRSMETSVEVAVTSFHPSPLGGGILLGRDTESNLRRAVIPEAVFGRKPRPGEIWRVTGSEHLHNFYGPQVHAQIALPLLPSGKAIIRYLATGRQFEGIGWTTASHLWERLGESLYDAIKQRDYATLAELIGPQKAVHLIEGFGLLSKEVEIFQWLDRYGVSPRTAATAASLWGKDAITRIEADPYALYLLESWRSVDNRALRLGVGLCDPRRLSAAVEEALTRRFRLGHTAATRPQVKTQVSTLLGQQASHLADQAIDAAIGSGRIVRHSSGLLQSRAAWFMEREIERDFAARLQCNAPPSLTWQVTEKLDTSEVEGGYLLAPRQREAVLMAVTSPVSIISGGAGTGKTTTVRAILDVLDRTQKTSSTNKKCEISYTQVALAGRAVKRISEMTGRKAITVARFLRELETGKRVPEPGLLIFDESSMLDVPSIYRILSALPSETRLLFIGDPGQLPPIGPGLLFQGMVDSGVIPQVELDVIHRQSFETGIPTVANSIRQGRMPDLPQFDYRNPSEPGVFVVPTCGSEVGSRVMQVLEAFAEEPPPPMCSDALHEKDIQVLCPTKNGPAGSKALNRKIESYYMVHQPQVHDWGLSVGSKITWLRNDYEKAPLKDEEGQQIVDPMTGKPLCTGFMNGALGVVRQSTEYGAWLEFDDGAEDEIRASDLEKLTHGWAISIHKAQGSAFRRVVVPITRSRLLDRALLYTAVTRAIETVVLVGDLELIRTAIELTPRVNERLSTINFEHTENEQLTERLIPGALG